jgi:LysM repeat protein
VRSGTPRSKTSNGRKPGGHKRPSPVQRAAQRAGRAAPALAVAGAIAASPQALAAPAQTTSASSAGTGHAITGHAITGHAITAHLDAAVRPASQAARTYTVQPGDTLAAIAQRFYGHAGDWRWLYLANRSTVSNPNLIKAGQVLNVPAGPPAAAVADGTYRPKHAKTTAALSTSGGTSAGQDPEGSSGSQGSTGGSGSQGSAGGSGSQGSAGGSSSSAGQGTVTCSANASGMVPANYATIVSFLTSHGYSGLAAAGIAGNIFQESEGNPESIGSGGGGLIGWTPLPSGMITGNPSADLQTQLSALLTYNEQWAQFIPALNAATSAVQAADIYMNDFERPGIPAAGNREAAAQAVASACGL